MNFKNWLFLIESATIAQSLKPLLKDPKIKGLKDQISKLVKQIGHALPAKTQEIIINFFTWNYKDSPATTLTADFNQTRDYLASEHQKLISKLNNPSFTINQLKQESNNWHEELKKTQGKAAEGETILALDHLGPNWKGWKWVSLNRSFCEKEKEAMGHCGNAGGRPDDNILSLRDKNNVPYLTFIENKGILGEMKGRQNDKQVPRYHPAIIELLKLDRIKTIKGGGFAPDRNFKLDDLPNKDEILKIKPNLHFPTYLKNLPFDEKIIVLSQALDEKLTIDEQKDILLSKFENTEDFLDWAKINTNLRLGRNTDTSFLDKIFDGSQPIEFDISQYEIKEAIEDLDDQNFEKIQNMAKEENISLENPEDINDLEDSPFKYHIMDLIEQATRYTYEQLYQSEYLSDFESSFSTDDDTDYILFRIYSPQDIRLVVNKKLMDDFLAKLTTEEDEFSLEKAFESMEFSYDPQISPNWDKYQFNDNLKDLL